jgi:hypothetical protein
MTDQPPPYQPPSFEPPPFPPTIQQPAVPPPFPPTTQQPAVPPPSTRKLPLVLAIIVLVFVVLGGIALGAYFALRSTGELDLTVDRCEIAADGTLTAAGTVGGPSGTGVSIDVEFVDIATDEVVDRGSVGVDLGTAPGSDPWTVEGNAGDEVRQVDCRVTADD